MNVRKVLLAVVLAAVLAVSALPQGAAAATDVFRFRNEYAFAHFSTFDDSSCIETGVSVGGYAYETRRKSGSTTSGEAYAWVTRYNPCSGEILFDAYGTNVDARVDINSRLTEASIVTTIEVYDYITGATLTLAVDMVWTGSGDLVRSSSRFQYDGPGYKSNYSDKGTGRAATATGSVSDGATQFTPERSYYARLGTSQGGSVDIEH